MGGRGLGSYSASAAVVLAAAGFLAFAAVRTSAHVGPSETLQAAFSSTDGLSAGSNVVVAGVKIGEVKSIMLDPATFLSDVRFTVASRLRLPADSSLAIEGGGLAGSVALVVQPGSSARRLHGGDIIDRTSAPSSLEHDVGTFIFGGGGLSDAE